jgi:broad specificity phosphatase PhoE
MKYGIPTSRGAGIFVFGAATMTRRVILIRHGELGEGCRGRYIGRTDAPLSERGKLQAAALAGELGRLKVAHLICSPLLRTRQTAEIALGTADACDIDPDLREIDFGCWEERGFTEIAAADPAVVERWAALDEDFAFPGGESVGDFSKRVGAVAGRIAADPAETVVAFTHGGVIRFLICRFLGLDVRHYLLFDIRPGSLTEIGIEAGKGVLTRLDNRCGMEGS